MEVHAGRRPPGRTGNQPFCANLLIRFILTFKSTNNKYPQRLHTTFAPDGWPPQVIMQPILINGRRRAKSDKKVAGFTPCENQEGCAD